jgi:hypothetical protein
VLAQQQEQWRRMRAIALSLGALLVVGIGLVWVINSQRPQPGRAVPIVGWEHIEDGIKAVDHNSTPPTSGQHYANPAPVGFYDRPVPNETQVHNLEHGQIMLQYTCSDCPELPERLRAFTQRYPKWVLVAPYPDPEGKVGTRIALTAWGRIDIFDEFDEQRITNFIEAFKNKGREVVMTD